MFILKIQLKDKQLYPIIFYQLFHFLFRQTYQPKINQALQQWRKLYILAQSKISQHINQLRMNPSSNINITFNFRYEIQDTNQLIDNHTFLNQIRSANPPATANTFQIEENFVIIEEKVRSNIKIGKKKERRSKYPIFSKIEEDLLLKEPLIKLEQVEGKSIIQDNIHIKSISTTTARGISNDRSNAEYLVQPPKQIKQEDDEQIKNSFNRKGLALISSLILEVLEGQYMQNKKFTCGQISAKVLTEFCNKSQEKITEATMNDKQRKTIKRRVYDSINVLIALGKIKKYHKFLYVESIDRIIGEEILQAKNEQVANMRAGFQKKQNLLKKVKLQYQKLLKLKQRNEQLLESKQQGFSGTFSTFTPNNSYKFPLLLVYSQPGNKLLIQGGQMSGQDQNDLKKQAKEQLIIYSDPIYIQSDLSSLQYLSMDQIETHRKAIFPE